MYLFCIIGASLLMMWILHVKSKEDDDDGPIWG